MDNQTCLEDANCMCWCSVKCGFRKKTDKDHPVYMDGDANGKFCYCKEWDFDNYQSNCIEKKNIKEPQGAQ